MRTTRVESVAAEQAELGDVVLACFNQACSEGRHDVAEHLLVAIERLSEEDESGSSGAEPHGLLADAYGVIWGRTESS